MVATKHCCYGVCKSDSRYSDRDHMKNVFFISFPKPTKDLQKCRRWVQSCRRENFGTENVTKDTYICSLHFVGGIGPTDDHPDPIPATFTPDQAEKLSKKRKPPTPRSESYRSRKMLRYDIEEAAAALMQLSSVDENVEMSSNPDSSLFTSSPDVLKAEPGQTPLLVDKSTQTEYEMDSPYLHLKIENMVLKNEIADLKCKHNSLLKTDKYFRIDDVKDNDKKCKFYTGLTWLQFLCLWNFLGTARDKLSYWRHPLKPGNESPRKRPGVKRKLDPMNQLFLTLVRLRTGVLHTDLAYRFGIARSSVSKIVITWFQFLFKRFSTLETVMFPTKDIIARNLPACFKPFKGIRVILDCSEFFVEQPLNFERQGNLYSSYKCHTTYKVLFGIAPSGAVTFISNAYEGSISDVEIVERSGLLDKLNRGDLVLADRGFTIKESLEKRGVDLNIPPFLKGRDKLTPGEEIKTKQIARVRIHVERSIERIKKFRLLRRVIPLSLQPVFSQMVFVAGCLVNFQEPLVQ